MSECTNADGCLKVQEECDRLRAELTNSANAVRWKAEENSALRAALAEAERERDDYMQAASVEAGLRREFLARAECAEADLAVARDRLKFLCDAVGRMDDASEEVYRRVTEARAFLERTCAVQ